MRLCNNECDVMCMDAWMHACMCAHPIAQPALLHHDGNFCL